MGEFEAAISGGIWVAAGAPAGARVGMGIYYFEELPLDPTRSPGDPS